MKKRLYLILIILISVFFSQSSFSAVTNATANGGTACAATGAMMTDDSDCRATPTEFSIQVYEMGLCSSHPYGDKTEIDIDLSTCTKTYSDTSPVAVDIAAAIGTTLLLTGTSTPPAEGTYGYPYIVIDKTLEVSGSFTNTPEGGSATTYYSAANNSISTSAADFASSTENLLNFGGANCESGYIGSAVTGGTMDGFITNTSFSRSETSDVTDEACDKNGRLVAVMSLNAPVVVTSDTIAVIFKFILTDFGSTFSDGDDAGVAPDSDGFGSAPFSGYFTVLNK